MTARAPKGEHPERDRYDDRDDDDRDGDKALPMLLVTPASPPRGDLLGRGHQALPPIIALGPLSMR